MRKSKNKKMIRREEVRKRKMRVIRLKLIIIIIMVVAVEEACAKTIVTAKVGTDRRGE